MRSDVCTVFRSLSVLHRPAHTQVCPGVLVHVLELKVLIARLLNDLLVMERRSGPDGVDTASFVVLVPCRVTNCQYRN